MFPIPELTVPATVLRFTRAVGLALMLLASPLIAQQVTVRDLPRPSSELEDPFSLVSGAIEFRPGQVLIIDGTELELSLSNFATGERTMVGRQGSGPGEYRTPAGLFRLSGDTIWLLDAAQQRLVQFLPDLKPGTTVPWLMFDQLTSTALSAPFFGDRNGNMYSSSMPIQIGRGAGGAQMQFPDSVGVIRMNPLDAKQRSEVARVRFPASGSPEMKQLGQNAFKFTMAYPGLVASDPWTVFPDGRIAIVRGATYAVEFISPDGQRSAAVLVPWEPIRVTNDDRKAEMDEAQRNLREQTKVAQKMMPPNFSIEFELLPPASWPASYPPVAPLGALAGADGRLWVKRATPIRLDREMWDVIDASGKLVARWRLPAKTTLVAVGQSGAVYTVRTDQDDLRYLQRVELPRQE
jgi:hypothetical protein